jgi:hypothetical protein
MVSLSGDELQLHDNARHYLLHQWFAPENRTLFGELSSRLAVHFKRAADAIDQDGPTRRALHMRELYHSLAANPLTSFPALEAALREARRRYALSEAQALITMVSDADGP